MGFVVQGPIGMPRLKGQINQSKSFFFVFRRVGSTRSRKSLGVTIVQPMGPRCLYPLNNK